MKTDDVPKGNDVQSRDTDVRTEGHDCKICVACGKPISDKYLLQAVESWWHEDCLKCSCCDCRLGEVGSSLYTKANLLLCRRDYLRLFGATGSCAVCEQVIPAFEMVMRAKDNVYHLECFACQVCNHRFCVGDRFYLSGNQVLCQYDYEERAALASMRPHFPDTPLHPYADTSSASGIADMTSQAVKSGCDDASSGYGSPSPPPLAT